MPPPPALVFQRKRSLWGPFSEKTLVKAERADIGPDAKGIIVARAFELRVETAGSRRARRVSKGTDGSGPRGASVRLHPHRGSRGSRRTGRKQTAKVVSPVCKLPSVKQTARQELSAAAAPGQEPYPVNLFSAAFSQRPSQAGEPSNKETGRL